MVQSIVITGSSRGIGRALAEEYLRRGANVHGVARSTPAIDHPGYTHRALDLADPDAVREALRETWPPCDLLLLNAGVLGVFGDLADASMADLRQTMNVNLWANKSLLDVALGAGHPPRQVVAISSGAAVSGKRGWSGYALSKAALNMLVQLYAAETPDTHFAAVAPGTIDTAMQDVLCALPGAETYGTLATLRGKRHTADMPTPEAAAPMLVDYFAELPDRVPSGAFVDVRKPLPPA